MTNAENEVLNRWKSRALRAEVKLFRAGLTGYDPSEMYSDAEWIVLTLEKKDGSSVHITELQAARAEVDAQYWITKANEARAGGYVDQRKVDELQANLGKIAGD